MDNLSLLVKPASGLCSLHCRYCFYRQELASYEELPRKIMSDEIMETLIHKACAEAKYSLSVTFQGGEPTLAGPDYFRRFVSLVREKKDKETEVYYSLQTNGMLLDEEWAAFLRDNEFLVGLSFDGTPKIHDSNRGRGSAKKVQEAWRLLRKFGVDTNLLCVVTAQAAKAPKQVYHGMKEMGGYCLQFIPCISDEKGDPWELTPKDYGHFLKETFDCWYEDELSGKAPSIRHLEDYMRIMMGIAPSSCAAMGRCGLYFVVEADGSVYPCDFYVSREYCLGNVCESSFEEMAESERMKAFLTKDVKSEKCRNCRYFFLCRGGCKRDYRGMENRYCSSYLEFFSHVGERLGEAGEKSETPTGG